MARWNAGELTLTVRLPAITAHVVGQVVALVEAARILTRPTTEPAIGPDAATRLAYGLVGRPGYEAERAAAQRVAARREERGVACGAGGGRVAGGPPPGAAGRARESDRRGRGDRAARVGREGARRERARRRRAPHRRRAGGGRHPPDPRDRRRTRHQRRGRA